MTLIVETGAGTRTANSYDDLAFILSYLTARGRETENSWSTAVQAVQEAHAINATQYIDTRWGHRFKGTRLTQFDGAAALAQLSFSTQPDPADALTLGTETYTFVSALSLYVANQVLIGVDTATTVANLMAAINQSAGSGTLYSVTTQSNDQAEAALLSGSTTEIVFTASQDGTSGNSTALSTTATNLAVDQVFVGGLDQGSQPLEFPRLGLFDRNGVEIIGVPLNLKEATAEYAVRSLGASLYQDPTVDATGRVVTEKFDKTGPIEERTKYNDGGGLDQLLKPYPAADRLLNDYLFPSGGILRG